MYFDSVNGATVVGPVIDGATPTPSPDVPTAVDPTDVLWRFFMVLALWPWPLPFNTYNMDAIVDRCPDRVNTAAVEGSMGWYLHTNVVVPLPAAGNGRFWNMTQAVTPANQRFITREAWIATMHRVIPESVRDFRQEMRTFSLTRHASSGRLLIRWPLYLSVTFPSDAPLDWHGIAASRLMPNILPHLDRCGFIPRPLCCDHPSYMILIWPHDAVWSNKCHREVILPLGERLIPSIFAALQSAYNVIVSTSVRGQPLPPLERLLPTLDIHLCDI